MFVEQPQSLHQQSLSGTSGAFLARAGVEINLERAIRPARYLVDGLISGERAKLGVVELALMKIHAALLAVFGYSQPAGLLPVFQGLEQINEIHLREPPADDTLLRGLLLHLLPLDAVEKLFGSGVSLGRYRAANFKNILHRAAFEGRPSGNLKEPAPVPIGRLAVAFRNVQGMACEALSSCSFALRWP